MDMYLSCFLAHRIAGHSRKHRLIDARLFERYRALLCNYRLLIAPFVNQAPFLMNEKTKLFDSAVDDCIRHRGGNLNLVVPVGVAGRGGFVNLSFCVCSPSSSYKAIVSREDLREEFDAALTSLYACGVRKDF